MSMAYKFILSLLISLGVSATLMAQTKLNSDAFFESAFNQMTTYKSSGNEPIKFPWIEDLQLRSETRDFDFDQQEYTLRLSPSTPKKIKAQAALLSHYQSSPDEASTKALQKVISNLYLDWLSLYFINEELALLDKLETIWTDKKTILQKLIGQYDIDFKDIISLEKDKNELTQLRYELQLESASILSLYSTDNAVDLDFSRIISIEDIEENLRALAEQRLTQSSLPDASFTHKQEELLKEIALEEAESQQYFDFIQLKYQGPHTDFWRERVSLGIGFQWPNDGNRKLKLAELKMEQNLLQQEKAIDDKETLQETNLLRSKLERRLYKAQHYANLKKQEAQELESIAKAIQQKQGYDPMMILDIKENTISNHINILNYNKDVYEAYVKYLSGLGKLGGLPFVNYLRV